MVTATFYVLATLCFFGQCPVPGLGDCPEVETLAQFDVAKYLGTWFEAKRYYTATEVNAKCVRANYTAGEKVAIRFVHSQIDYITGRPLAFDGNLLVRNSSEPAKLKMKFDSMPVVADYWVLGTGYDNYAVVYSCTVRNLVKSTDAWILTREQSPPDSVIDEALAVARTNNLDPKAFLDTDQKNCG